MLDHLASKLGRVHSSPMVLVGPRWCTLPPVQHHYSAFIPTLGCSAPVLRIGTQSVARITRSARSLRIRATGSHVPSKSPIQIHAAFEPDAARAGLQVSALAYPEATTTSGFDINYKFSAVHRRLPGRPMEFHHQPPTEPCVTSRFTRLLPAIPLPSHDDKSTRKVDAHPGLR